MFPSELKVTHTDLSPTSQKDFMQDPSTVYTYSNHKVLYWCVFGPSVALFFVPNIQSHTPLPEFPILLVLHNSVDAFLEHSS